jgi:hypothetical protein
MVICRALSEILSNNNAPKPEPMIVRATEAGIPRAIITGTVIKDVLPVTTLITLVKKNTAIKTESFAPDTRP